MPHAHHVFADFNNKGNWRVKATNIMDKLKEKGVTYESIQNQLLEYTKNRIESFNYINVTGLLREANTFRL